MIAFQAAASVSPAPSFLETDIVTRLSSAMRELAFAGQTVDADALCLKGFTFAEVDTNFRAARDRATRESIRRVA
jgi:hypothetical protein